MKDSPILLKIKKEGMSFLKAASEIDERIYLILFTLYLVIYFILNISWEIRAGQVISNVRYALLGVVMWGSAVYLFFVIAAWKDLWRNNFLLLLIGILLVGATAIFSKEMTTNAYGVVMDIFFIVMAYRKDYRKMLRIILVVSVVMLLVAGIGMRTGFALDMVKPENIHPGHSLGIVYPNTWGYLAFLVLMVFWYLFLRNRIIITVLVFWAVSLFMYFYICCRTIAGITLVFPVMAVVVDLIERKTKKQDRISPVGWVVVAIPFLAFGFMMFMSMQYKWLHKHFYQTWFHNLAMRFVQGGLYFKTYGLPLVGNPYRSNVHTYVNVNGSFEEVGILDSSFASYMIMRGLLWILMVMCWLCLAHWKALKKHDFGIPFLSLIILLFAMMERPGLEMWYNFILLYPLAKVVSKTGEATGEENTPELSESADAEGLIRDEIEVTAESPE
ncbi:MAG: hypothetical protein IJT43_04420 [Stomatobaculum sp.]|nr:hypothetical protein [Stomatobaculum sp.]